MGQPGSLPEAINIVVGANNNLRVFSIPDGVLLFDCLAQPDGSWRSIPRSEDDAYEAFYNFDRFLSNNLPRRTKLSLFQILVHQSLPSATMTQKRIKRLTSLPYDVVSQLIDMAVDCHVMRKYGSSWVWTEEGRRFISSAYSLRSIEEELAGIKPPQPIRLTPIQEGLPSKSAMAQAYRAPKEVLEDMNAPTFEIPPSVRKLFEEGHSPELSAQYPQEELKPGPDPEPEPEPEPPKPEPSKPKLKSHKGGKK